MTCFRIRGTHEDLDWVERELARLEKIRLVRFEREGKDFCADLTSKAQFETILATILRLLPLVFHERKNYIRSIKIGGIEVSCDYLYNSIDPGQSHTVYSFNLAGQKAIYSSHLCCSFFEIPKGRWMIKDDIKRAMNKEAI